MAAIAPHMQRAYTNLTRELALAMQSFRQASGNVQYAADLIGYRRKKGK